MTKISVPVTVVKDFITYIVDVESLDPVYADYLQRYPTFTESHSQKPIIPETANAESASPNPELLSQDLSPSS